MARGKCCYFFIPTGREKRTEFAKKEGRFFKFVETGEVDAPVFTRVENPGINIYMPPLTGKQRGQKPTTKAPCLLRLKSRP